MTPRRSLTRAQCVRVFDAAGGICHICKQPILVGQKWQAEHPDPLWAGGSDNLDDLRPAHDLCHKQKSAREAKQRAKETRQRADHLGVPRKASRPMPHGKNSPTKKTFNHGVVAR